MQRKKCVFIVLTVIAAAGCASQRVSTDEPVNRALKICGLGIDARSADAFRLAIESAEKKGGSFETEASNAVQTQVGILLKQAEQKTDASTRAVAEEIKATRECVISQVSASKPATRADLLEQCRLDIERRLSPPGPIKYGTLRGWIHEYSDTQGQDSDFVVMQGMFDTGGCTSTPYKVRCDLRNGRFNEAVVVEIDRQRCI
jgi:hypothetical protein